MGQDNTLLRVALSNAGKSASTMFPLINCEYRILKDPDIRLTFSKLAQTPIVVVSASDSTPAAATKFRVQRNLVP